MNVRRLFPSRGRASADVRIFVSYRRDDASAHAGRLYDALSTRFGPENVFMDVDAIGLGSDYRETIDGAIASCDVAIALVGRGWLAATDEAGRRRLDDPGDVLRLELEQALAHELVVVPALVGGAELPAEEELPASLAPLVRRQGIELRDSVWRDDVERLIRRLDAIPTPREAGSVPGATGGRRRTWLLLGAVVAAAAAAAVLALALRAEGGGDADGDETVSSNESGAVRELLAAIPLPLRTECQAVDYGPEAALAHVECGAAKVAVSYHLFDRDVLPGWYALFREDTGIVEGTGACGGGTFRGEAAYSVGGAAAGRWFCFMDGEEPNLVWTDERAAVGAYANVWDGTGQEAAESLLRQWQCCLRPQS